MQMTVLPPVDVTDVGKPQHDQAKDGYSIRALERLLIDCDEQPIWRPTSDMCCAYYDSKQMTAQQEWEYRKNQLEPRVVNLVQRTINGVLGQEAKSRRDPHLEPDDDEGADVADVLNVKLKEAQRETCADMAISNGYAGQVKAGIGWVEVSRVSDPRLYPYRVVDVHRSEMYWDWRAKKVDLSDARWLVRRQWKDLDEAIAEFPEHRVALENSVDNWARWLVGDDLGDERQQVSQWFDDARRFNVHRSEWIDGARRRVRLYEVWYRVPASMVMMQVGQRWIMVDERNPLHMEAISRKLVKLKRAVTSQVRKAIFAGPFRILDEATERTRFPYIPFFAFRTDIENTPYGLIHGMIPVQDEYNERRMRIQWMLKAQQLDIDNDALDERYNNIEDIANNAMRPDMVTVLNKDRRNAEGIRFRNNFQLQKEQFEVMQDAKQLIQDIPGIYGTQLGNAPAGVTSGLAINSLVEQGIVAMGELNDNYVHARRLVYDELVDLIAEDHAEHDLQVAIGTGSTRRIVVLNTIDPETRRAVNVVKDAKVTTGLAEVPASPAYQMQSSQMMGDMIRALAGTPQAALMIPAYVETTSAFGSARKQLADDMRRMSGLPTAGDRQGAQQWQQQQQQAAQRQAQLAEANAKVEIEGKAAKTGLDQAKVEQTRADTALTLIQADTLANDPDEASLIDEAIAEAAMAHRQSRPGPAAPGVA